MDDHSFPGLFLKVSGIAYLILMGDVLLMATTAPVWLIFFLTPLSQSWLALALVSPLLAPAVAGAFTVFRAYVVDGSTSVIRGFFRGWQASAKKSLVLGLAGAGLAIVIVVDLQAVAGATWSPLTLPGFVMAAVLGLITILTGLALIVARPATGRWAALRAGLLLGVRGGGWSLVSVSALAGFAWMLWDGPALALIAAPAPVLFVVWYDANRALAPLLDPDAAPRREPAWAN